MDQAIKTFFDSQDFPSKSDRRFHGGPDNGVQSRAIAAAREDAHSHRSSPFGWEIVLEKSTFLKVFHLGLPMEVNNA